MQLSLYFVVGKTLNRLRDDRSSVGETSSTEISIVQRVESEVWLRVLAEMK